MTTRCHNKMPFASQLTKTVAAMAIVALLFIGAGLVHADQIKLNARASMQAGEVTLKDVAELQGQDAIALGSMVIGNLQGDSLTIAMSDIRKKLDEKNVNWGRLSLRGFMQCQVNTSLLTRNEPLKPVVSDQTGDGNAVANPPVYVASDSLLTVGDRVTAELVRRSGLSSDELRIQFAVRDQETLALSVLQDRWEVEPLNSAKLGRVLVTVRQWQGDRITNTYRLTADVAHRALCVVSKHDVKRGVIFTMTDVEIQEVYLQDEHNEPAYELRSVIGKVAKQPVNKGQVVIADQIAKPDLIKRGDRLTVRCIVGGMVIKTTARAMESGAMSDDISVSNLDSNERFVVRITGNREAMISLSPSSSPASSQPIAPVEPAASAKNIAPSVLATAKESRS